MTDYTKLEPSELETLYSDVTKEYNHFKSQNLSLNMSRGKPGSKQLDLSMNLLDQLSSKDLLEVEEDIDVRNYGGLDGIKEAKQLFAQILEVDPDQVLVGGNSSSNMMYDTITRALLRGVVDSERPWIKEEKVTFLCPSPGYDRHFGICESLNIHMIPIDILDDGPDMDQVEALVSVDESIKGMWCVPKYSNPEGVTYSDDVVERLANMETKAPDFKIFWDNAYAVHHLSDDWPDLQNILKTCEKAGNPNRVFVFTSTSKITFPGSGVAAMAANEENLAFTKEQLSFQMIGPDKLNQLRHSRFFPNIEAVHHHMKKQADLIKPKFDVVVEVLNRELGSANIATWREPKGGYFISLNTLEGCANQVVKMAKETGVIFTEAGATFPYGVDPKDQNIRIAPTYPTLSELKSAIEVLCVCIKRVTIEKLLKTDYSI